MSSAGLLVKTENERRMALFVPWLLSRVFASPLQDVRPEETRSGGDSCHHGVNYFDMNTNIEHLEATQHDLPAARCGAR